jgi:hypothetical protein
MNPKLQSRSFLKRPRFTRHVIQIDVFPGASVNRSVHRDWVRQAVKDIKNFTGGLMSMIFGLEVILLVLTVISTFVTWVEVPKAILPRKHLQDIFRCLIEHLKPLSKSFHTLYTEPPLRIELRFESYQDPVLPLNYGGKSPG